MAASGKWNSGWKRQACHDPALRVACALVGCALLICSFANVCAAANTTPQLKIVHTAVGGQQDLVRVLVTATDGDGHAIKGLSIGQFSAAVDGNSARLSSLESASTHDQPLAVVLALDISGSMRSDGAFAAARKAALAFIAELDDADVVSLISFGNSAQRLTGFTDDRNLIRQALDELKAADQRTVLYDGMFKAAQQATQATSNKVVVIVLTDGRDEGSSVTLQDATQAAAGQAIPIYTLGFGPAADQKTLRRIAELTGGAYFYAPSIAELPGLYQAVGEQLKDGYLLTANTQALHAGTHKLAVRVGYRGQRLADEADLVIPRPRLPWWVGAITVAVVAFALLLACVGWAVTRRRGTERLALQPRAAAQVWIDVVDGPQRNRRVRMLGKIIRIGRAPDSELRSKDSSMATHQAELVMQDNAVLLEDGGSDCPTLLNGNRLRPRQSVRLRDGDRIKAGTSTFIFCDRRQVAPNPRSVAAAAAQA